MRKIQRIIPMLLVAFIMIGSQTVFAQEKETAHNCDKGECVKGITDLTDVQKQKIDGLCLAHKKEMTGIKNQINEKRAHLKTLQAADKADMTAINKTIDEISALNAEQMKKGAANKQSIRDLLTEKQKIIFDANGGKHGGAGCSHGAAAGDSKCSKQQGGKSCCPKGEAAGGCGK
ncbi:MAG: Spy/CpxP family protein refolding chaperone, partial [Bacteroidia bacterium]|nr:Spy/CpxP family protein refolding chaperone [Bacteroidia bacterium]